MYESIGVVMNVLCVRWVCVCVYVCVTIVNTRMNEVGAFMSTQEHAQ